MKLRRGVRTEAAAYAVKRPHCRTCPRIAAEKRRKFLPPRNTASNRSSETAPRKRSRSALPPLKNKNRKPRTSERRKPRLTRLSAPRSPYFPQRRAPFGRVSTTRRSFDRPSGVLLCATQPERNVFNPAAFSAALRRTFPICSPAPDSPLPFR